MSFAVLNLYEVNLSDSAFSIPIFLEASYFSVYSTAGKVVLYNIIFDLLTSGHFANKHSLIFAHVAPTNLGII